MAKQMLHLVFGGGITELDRVDFSDPDNLHIVGIYPNYQDAYDAWKAESQRSVDNAHMRYFIVHLHKFLQPEAAETVGPDTKASAA